jgi:membrane peptidoglycan carboxypeptidase
LVVDEEPTTPKRKRWRRWLTRAVVVALFWGGTGAAAAEAYVDSIPLPGDPPDPQASTLYYNDGRTILARVGTTDHSDVPLSAIPVAVRDTVLAAEDRDFYSHWGVSARGVLRALVADAGGARQGASTITQQYARNAFLSQDVTVDRKAREFALSIKLERQFSKDQILEKYLNTIYFGRGAYGIAAAAHAYFGITTDRLTAAQGAVLAAVVKDPYAYDPAVDAKAARNRWNWIVTAAAEQGWLRTDEQRYPAVQPRDNAAVDGPNGLVVDQIEHELAAHGVSSQELHTRGLQITTTLDPVAQKAALSVVAQQLRKQPRGLQAALVAVDPRSGAVRAYYGGDRGRGYYDYASAIHPAASTFKPIVLAAALRAGIGYQSRWDGSSPRIFPGRNGVPLKNHNDLQCPDCTLERSMVDSLNTPFYAVTERVGADRVRAMAVDLGISNKYDGRTSMVDVKGDPKPGHTRPDIAIGRYPVSPGDLASVYATFAAGGVRNDRYFVQSAADAAGRVLREATPTGATVLDAKVAADVSTVLSAVVKGDDVVPGRPAAGKTGTQQWGNTKDNQDAWMAGYTPDLAAAVWLGKAAPGPIRDAHNKPIAGETVPARVWRDFLSEALHGKPKEPLPPPAHVGRNDVGDANTHGAKSPDDVANARAATGGFDPVVHTAGQGRRLALTFDDGPSDYTPAILDLLDKYRIKATFCMVGEQVAAYPATVRRIVADGHRLCNHSMHHDDLADMSQSRIKDDIGGTDAGLATAVPGATVPYFRAPYGDWGASAKIGAQLGHTPLGWLVDPDDWMLPGADVIASRIEQQLTPRAVVLVHDGGGDRRQTIDALKKAIPRLLDGGWKFDFPATTVQANALPAGHEEAGPTATATADPPTDAGKPSAPAGDQPPGDETGGTGGDGKPTGRPEPGDSGRPGAS